MKKLIALGLFLGLILSIGLISKPYSVSSVHKIQSEEEFNDYVLEVIKNMNKNIAFYTDRDHGVAPESKDDSAPSHTKTNNQIANIDEADVLKTNGRKTFYLDSNRLIITNTDPTKDVGLEHIFDLKNEDNVYYQSLLLVDNKLILIGERYYAWCGTCEPFYGDVGTPKISNDQRIPYNNFTPMTFIRVLDIDNLDSLAFSQTFDIEGQLLAARLHDNNLYLVTQKYNYHLYEKASDVGVDDVLPHRVYNNMPIENKVSEISILNPDSLDTMTLTKLDVKNKNITSSTYMGNAQQVLLTDDGLLVASVRYVDWNKSKTSILRFDVDHDLSLMANTEFEGYLLSSYAMDYYDGYVRVAITKSSKETTDNAIYVFDDALKLVGSLDHLAHDETIYSVLFKQDKAYVVTFKQIDPFFVIDLSNPTQPKVAGELKIPGYSSYLYQVDQNSVIGFGKDVKFDNGFFTQGPFKVSLFDVSNPANPNEKDVLFAGGTYSTSDVMVDPKALMVDSTRNLFGFVLLDNVMTISSEDNIMQDYNYNQNFILMNVDQGKINIIMNLPSDENEYFIRSIIVENSLFVFTNQSFKLIDLDSLSTKTIKY